MPLPLARQPSSTCLSPDIATWSMAAWATRQKRPWVVGANLVIRHGRQTAAYRWSALMRAGDSAHGGQGRIWILAFAAPHDPAAYRPLLPWILPLPPPGLDRQRRQEP